VAAAPPPTQLGMGQTASMTPGMAAMPPTVVPAPPPVPLAASGPDAPVAKPKKVGRCWKCAVNTHATKDCKVLHYCLVCDFGAHPTIPCPILKIPKPMSFFVGCGNDATLDLQILDSVYKPQSLPSGAPTTLVQVSGEGTITAADIQSLMARMCPGNPACKWELHVSGRRWLMVQMTFLLGFLQLRTYRELMVCR
jgi:hypothetical protein